MTDRDAHDPNAEAPSSSAQPSQRRLTIADGLIGVAMIAANLTMIAQIVKVSSDAYAAWFGSVFILGTNAILCAFFGVALRFRLIRLMGVFTTASLTEAMLLQTAAASRSVDWIPVVAVFGALLLGALGMGLNAVRRR